MATAMTSTLPWVMLLLLVAAAATAGPLYPRPRWVSRGRRFGGEIVQTRSSGRRSLTNTLTSSSRDSLFAQIQGFRGGSNDDIDEEEYDYDDEYDNDNEKAEEVEPIVTNVKKLAASTITATAKKAAQNTAANKAKVNAAIAKISSTKGSVKTKGSSNWYKRTVPYIIRACLNPFTVWKMTKAYFVSLMDINYLKEVSFETAFVDFCFNYRLAMDCHWFLRVDF